MALYEWLCKNLKQKLWTRQGFTRKLCKQTGFFLSLPGAAPLVGAVLKVGTFTYFCLCFRPMGEFLMLVNSGQSLQFEQNQTGQTVSKKFGLLTSCNPDQSEHHSLTLIGKSWKTHSEILLKFSFSGSSHRRFYWKTHPFEFIGWNHKPYRYDMWHLVWMSFPVKRSQKFPRNLPIRVKRILQS